MRVDGWFRFAAGAVLGTALLGSGCGGTTTDVSKGVASINKDLAPRDVRVACPKTVDGGAGTVFTCTITNTRNRQSTKIRFKVVKQGDQLKVAPVSNAEAAKALQRIGAA